MAHRVESILERLDDGINTPIWKPSGEPVDELVATILSQNTSDTNTERAFASLRGRFSTWRDVSEAPVDEVRASIHVGGLSAQKAPRIQRALKELLDESESDGNETLNRRLGDLDVSEAMQFLTSLPGVGPKTAACVLLFAVGKPIVPVDTHVYRVSRRIGLIDSRATADAAHDVLTSLVNPEDAYRFHMLLIRHGRYVCRARTPRCSACVLVDLCDYAAPTGQNQGDTQAASAERSAEEL